MHKILKTASSLTIALALPLAACSGDGARIPAPPETQSLKEIALTGGDLNDFFECLEAEGVTLISAHRGGKPENSLTGMRNTLSEIPAIMEADVAQTRDGVVFLMHDSTLERTTTGSGAVAEATWDEIRALKIKGPQGEVYDEHPPRLEDVLAFIDGKTVLQIDFKRSAKYEDVIAAVKAAGATDRVIYIAYTFAQAEKLHRLHPEAMISMTLDDLEDYDAALATGIPADRIIGWTGNTAPNQAVFDQLNANDIEVIFGTLGGANSQDNAIAASGNDARYAEIAAMGVDVLATNRPLVAAAVIGFKPVCGLPEK